MSNTGNWMHIRYQSKLQARKALSKDGRIFGESIMIGVKPCIDKVSWLVVLHVWCFNFWSRTLLYCVLADNSGKECINSPSYCLGTSELKSLLVPLATWVWLLTKVTKSTFVSDKVMKLEYDLQSWIINASNKTWLLSWRWDVIKLSSPTTRLLFWPCADMCAESRL